MTTILDWLYNAEHNIGSPNPNSRLIAMAQLQNAILLLANGYCVHTNVEPLIEKYGSVDSIPPREEYKAQC